MLDSICLGSKRTLTFDFLPMLGATPMSCSPPAARAMGGAGFKGSHATGSPQLNLLYVYVYVYVE